MKHALKKMKYRFVVIYETPSSKMVSKLGLRTDGTRISVCAIITEELNERLAEVKSMKKRPTMRNTFHGRTTLNKKPSF